ncbi:MAG: YtxH domain-containing protein [Anaerolineales bacterium]
MRRFMNFFIGAIFGGVMGALLAIMLAPSSGEEIRLELRERVAKFQNELRQAAAQRRAELEEQLDALRNPTPPNP